MNSRAPTVRPTFRPPEHGASPFVCPHCGVAAKQDWRPQLAGLGTDPVEKPLLLQGYQVAQCQFCGKPNIWELQHWNGTDDKWVQVHPQRTDALPAAPNMPGAVLQLYNEARAISFASPRAACALLRLAVEQLLDHLGAEGHSLNDKVGWLVRQGVATNVQMALDAVRVSGNRAVHPLEIVEDDAPEMSDLLFRLVNYVVEALVTGRQDIQCAYERLPDKAKRAIDRRDRVA